jgi:arylsulfatase
VAKLHGERSVKKMTEKAPQVSMNRRQFLAGLGATVAHPLFRGLASTKQQQPNIILILVDDMGFSDLGCYGSEIDTPNLDKLARNGMRFAQFYNTAKCSPTRTSLLTGHYWQTVGKGIRRGGTMAQALRVVGYETLALGKWHLLGKPWKRGFDRYFGHLSGATHYFKGDNTFYLDGKHFQIPPKGFYTTDADTDYALHFIDDHYKRNSEKPFFLYLAYNAPHFPLHAKQNDIDKYRGAFKKGWDRLRNERYQRQLDMGLIQKKWELSPRPQYIPAWDTLTEEERDFEDLRMSVYAGMIDCVDQNIGRLMSNLHQHNVADNTLVMFLSDNGGCPFDRRRQGMPGSLDSWWEYGVAWANVSNTPFRLYKRCQHEGGIATPFIAHWPTVIKTKGSISDTPAHLIDILPTCMEISNYDYHCKHQGENLPAFPGKSLLPLFKREVVEARRTLFFHYGKHRALISGKWKIVSAYTDNWELYDLEEDRTELHDLAERYPDKVEELNAVYRKWWEQNNLHPFFLGEPEGGPPQYRRVL